jgi:hypothetical protein
MSSTTSPRANSFIIGTAVINTHRGLERDALKKRKDFTFEKKQESTQEWILKLNPK